MNPSASRVVSLALILVAMISLMPAAEAYVYSLLGKPNPEGVCYDGETTIPINEDRQRMGRCEKMSCTKDYTLYIYGCGAVAAGPGFITTPTDYSKPYPECCPQLAPAPTTNLV